jgi:23S rRNA U2552 (ribose-2'-O)-methylase RlmE/FtsJ
MNICLKVHSVESQINDSKINYINYVNVNDSLNTHLITWKNKINDNKSWDTAKRLSNTYEFIFSSGYNKVSVSKKKPLSRSYFKLWEILHDFHLISDNMKSAHIAEGPGGFIECISDYINKHNQQSSIYGITLKSTNKKIPSWKIPKWLLTKNNIHIYDTDDGNIYNMTTINNFVHFVGKHSCDFVTADGGFDFSADFNNQEIHSLKLMACEVFTALQIQKYKGAMLLKVFDIFSLRTIKLISLCTDFYETFTILKPQTSRPANSEKYILFQNNVYTNTENQSNNLKLLTDCIEKNDISLLDAYDNFYNDLISITKYNIVYTSNQIKSLNKTLELSNNKDLSKYMNERKIQGNIDICKRWCDEYNIDYNN